MSFYSDFIDESTGLALTAMTDFNTAPQGAVFKRKDGVRYIKNSLNAWERSEYTREYAMLTMSNHQSSPATDARVAFDQVHFVKNISLANNQFTLPKGKQYKITWKGGAECLSSVNFGTLSLYREGVGYLPYNGIGGTEVQTDSRLVPTTWGASNPSQSPFGQAIVDLTLEPSDVIYSLRFKTTVSTLYYDQTSLIIEEM